MRLIKNVLHPTEHEEACALMKWCELNTGRWPELSLFFAVPNGGGRPTRLNRRGTKYSPEAIRLKEEGVKRGVPDYCLPVSRLNYHGLFIELKTLVGKLSPEQRSWLSSLQAQGYMAVMCRGWMQAAETLKAYLRSDEHQS